MRKRPINRRAIDSHEPGVKSRDRGNAISSGPSDPEPEFRGRAPRGRPTKTTKELRRRRSGRWNSRVVHVVQRSNRNMAGAYDGPPKFLLRGRGERGERGPVSPSRTSRLCIACIARYGRMTRSSNFLELSFILRGRGRRPPPFRSRNHRALRIFFMTRFSRIIIYVYIYIYIYIYLGWYFNAVKPRDTDTRRPRTELEQ